jgi:hypothetical protein
MTTSRTNCEDTVQQNPPNRSRRASPWLDRARELADASDRWFVQMARGLGTAAGMAADRARSEAVMVSESARKAADTTMEVTRKVADGLARASPERPSIRQTALLKALRLATERHAARLDAMEPGRFEQLVEEITAQLSFELSTLPEPPGDKSVSQPERMKADGSSEQEPDRAGAIVKALEQPMDADAGREAGASGRPDSK